MASGGSRGSGRRAADEGGFTDSPVGASYWVTDFGDLHYKENLQGEEESHRTRFPQSYRSEKEISTVKRHGGGKKDPY